MSIDDKSLGGDGFTILSNSDTGKIALMVESTNAQEVEQAMALFGIELNGIKNISMDMSATYALVMNNLIPCATQVIDKFHVMKYVSACAAKSELELKSTLPPLSQKRKKEQNKISKYWRNSNS